MTTTVFVIGWVFLFLAVLALEVGALVRKEYGDTLSEQVWKLMKTLPGAFVLVTLWLWLTWHFFVEPAFFEQWFLTTWIDDYIVVGLGLLAAMFLRREND